MVVRFLFWLASRMSRQIPLFDFVSGLRLISDERNAAIDAKDNLGFLRREVGVTVRVLAECDLDGIRGRRMC